MSTSVHQTSTAVIEALVALSSVDAPYGDLYLQRAQQVFEEVLGEEPYRALCHEREGLTRLAKELREVAEHADWSQARCLAQHGVRSRERLADHQQLLVLGDAVYAPRLFCASPTTLALGGIGIEPMPPLNRVRETCVSRLQFLADHDGQFAQLYRMRLAHFAALQLPPDGDAPATADRSDFHHRIIEAAEQADFALAERLSAAMMDFAKSGAASRSAAPPDTTASLPPLTAAFPDTLVRRAQHLGLTAVTLAADPAVDGYLRSCDQRITLSGGARRPPIPAAPGGRLDDVHPQIVSDGLREVLDRLLLHPFVTSAGCRYLPSFEAETLLVETFPESDPAVRTGLLSALNLRGRRGLSRLVLEHTVRSRGGHVCAELGLDPALYAVIPIPFDAYSRLAPRFDWGKERIWTHFDGYEATRELSLRALVGGDAAYGGAEDLCSVARDYASERIVARFCVVRRHRLMLRAA